jgi:hypothetical protein
MRQIRDQREQEVATALGRRWSYQAPHAGARQQKLEPRRVQLQRVGTSIVKDDTPSRETGEKCPGFSLLSDLYSPVSGSHSGSQPNNAASGYQLPCDIELRRRRVTKGDWAAGPSQAEMRDG